MCTQYELCTNVKGLYTVKNQQHVKGSCLLACILEHASMILNTYILQGHSTHSGWSGNGRTSFCSLLICACVMKTYIIHTCVQFLESACTFDLVNDAITFELSAIGKSVLIKVSSVINLLCLRNRASDRFKDTHKPNTVTLAAHVHQGLFTHL